ncbi:unnamed protein product [Soboliphyme baturini]|uniref:Archease domain-containing protein n=1 Tax=Soboliphyme baturini TaxID=241478 RepID=A0A183IQD0_9BILA|nr:unnamed protein product [Soboliphyme baturini]
MISQTLDLEEAGEKGWGAAEEVCQSAFDQVLARSSRIIECDVIITIIMEGFLNDNCTTMSVQLEGSCFTTKESSTINWKGPRGAEIYTERDHMGSVHMEWVAVSEVVLAVYTEV